MSDIEIARQAKLLPIIDLARDRLGIPAQQLDPYGHYKAKLDLDFIHGLEDRPDGKLILVTAISPTPAGEGKTTTTVGLGDALNRIGRKALICLREPSLGPCFGVKGGAAGGGHAQVVPMEDINLHFTGDFHAIGVAHNLLAALIDNHISHGNALGIDPRRIQWKRVVDMNDRALRHIVVGLGGTPNGYLREDGFDIVVASEVMAILCLARDLEDLKERLGRIVIGYKSDGRTPVFARDLRAHGAMAALLRDAIKPNLVQTLENNLAFIHGGPFANIAHGCNTVMATHTALKLADYVVTEAGFGADLGAEKFIDIKCRMAGLNPAAIVLVATVRHGQPGAPCPQHPRALPAALRGCGQSFQLRYRGGNRLSRVPLPGPGRGGGGGPPLGRGRRRSRGTGAGGGGPGRQPAGPAWLCLRGQRAAVGQDRGHRHAHLRCRQRQRRRQGAPAAGTLERGASRLSGLHGQDPDVLLHRRRRQGRAHGPRCPCPRGQAGERCRFRGRDRRQRHDHAGLAAGAGGRVDRRRRARPDQRAVLTSAGAGGAPGAKYRRPAFSVKVRDVSARTEYGIARSHLAHGSPARLAGDRQRTGMRFDNNDEINRR